MHLIYQSRLLRLLALLWFSAALLAACSQEPKQRAAFIFKRDRRALFLRWLVTAFKTSGRSGKNDLWHRILHLAYADGAASDNSAPRQIDA